MGNRAKELLNNGKSVLFAFEEAIGTHTHTHTHTQTQSQTHTHTLFQ